MIKGIGIDIVETDRIRDAVQKWGDKFLNKIFNDIEISYCNKKKNIYECFAARFAAKEAFIKALSDLEYDGEMPRLTNIVILNHASGKPCISVREDLAERHVINLSISHERHYAVAMVILESTKK
ncbi:MAG: holo-ACP synthase [Dissulfurispiraceae bacterium]|jgi:holo-[acyl-carrier protein] synthase